MSDFGGLFCVLIASALPCDVVFMRLCKTVWDIVIHQAINVSADYKHNYDIVLEKINKNCLYLYGLYLYFVP